jgi:Zn-finger nucleic acid-binding protein
MTERQNVEIDYCPKCRGVWLDRGELDKIVEKALAQQHGAPQAPTQAQACPDHRSRGEHHGYRRKSWLSDIFD